MRSRYIKELYYGPTIEFTPSGHVDMDVFDESDNREKEVLADFYDEEIENNKILINTLKIALEYNLPTIIHGSEPVGHSYPGKGRNLPEKLYSLAKKNPSNKFIFSHFGGGLVFYEHMPEVKEALRNVYYDSAAQPFLYDKKIYKNAISSSNIKKILFASDYPLINIKRCLSQLSDLSEDEKNHILSYNPISVFNL